MNRGVPKSKKLGEVNDFFINYRIFSKTIGQKTKIERGGSGDFFQDFFKIRVKYRPKKQNCRRLGRGYPRPSRGRDTPEGRKRIVLLTVDK